MKELFNFLEELQKNNNREWFTDNKKTYESSKDFFEELVSQLIISISTFDLEIKYLNPKKCIFRIYRDIRFSKDKTPYKTHFGAVFSERKGSGYYMHLEPKKSFLSCGHYALTPEELKKIRTGIYENFKGFHTIINQQKFKENFGDLCRDNDTLKRVPNGFDKDHPAAEYLKLKHFYIIKKIPKEKLYSHELVTYASEIFKQMQPLNEFLNDLIRD